MRIEHLDLTFLNLPMVEPEMWAWGRRDSYTVGLVRLYTESGVVGVGEVNVCMGPDEHAIRAIFDQMSTFAVGESALMPERIASKIFSNGWYAFHRTAALVLGGIDMACWDAAGNHYGQPISTLLGGALRSTFTSMYFVQGNDDLDVMLERGRDALERGFKTIYFKVGIEEERDVELSLRMREVIGPGPKLRIDANEAWYPGTAVRILRRLAPGSNRIHRATDSHARHRGARTRPGGERRAVAANQASWGKYAILDIVKPRRSRRDHDRPPSGGRAAADEEGPRPLRDGGPPFVNHAFNATTMTITAHLHVMSTSPVCFLAMQGHPDYLADDYVTAARLPRWPDACPRWTRTRGHDRRRQGRRLLRLVRTRGYVDDVRRQPRRPDPHGSVAVAGVGESG